MHVHLIYRLYPGENAKRRPAYHSKQLCLRSALRALAAVPDHSVVLLVDGDALPDDYAWVHDVAPGVDVRTLGGVGNAASYRLQLGLVEQLPPDDFVYLSEDDHLYAPDAFAVLAAALPDLPHVDYLSLYDHPDRYTRGDDAVVSARSHVWFAGGRHWRRIESTCMSFGGWVRVMQRDMRIHRRFVPKGGATRVQRWLLRSYNDRRLWRRLQGLSLVHGRGRRRVLVSPIPSLSTHMDTSFLAPGVDWAAVAAAAQ